MRTWIPIKLPSNSSPWPDASQNECLKATVPRHKSTTTNTGPNTRKDRRRRRRRQRRRLRTTNHPPRPTRTERNPSTCRPRNAHLGQKKHSPTVEDAIALSGGPGSRADKFLWVHPVETSKLRPQGAPLTPAGGCYKSTRGKQAASADASWQDSETTALSITEMSLTENPDPARPHKPREKCYLLCFDPDPASHRTRRELPGNRGSSH